MSNERMVYDVNRAMKCVNTLDAYKVHVLRVEVEHSQPTVWVQFSKGIARKLHGLHFKTESTTGKRMHTYQAQVQGCRVQWTCREDES